MSNNFTYKYASGAEVTLKSTENATVTPAVHTPHIILSDGTTPIKHPTNSFAVSGASALTILTASAGNRHRIFNMTVTANTTGTLTISDGFGAVYAIIGTPIALDFKMLGKLQTTVNTNITITNSGGGNVSAHGTYSTEAV